MVSSRKLAWTFPSPRTQPLCTRVSSVPDQPAQHCSWSRIPPVCLPAPQGSSPITGMLGDPPSKVGAQQCWRNETLFSDVALVSPEPLPSRWDGKTTNTESPPSLTRLAQRVPDHSSPCGPLACPSLGKLMPRTLGRAVRDNRNDFRGSSAVSLVCSRSKDWLQSNLRTLLDSQPLTGPIGLEWGPEAKPSCGEQQHPGHHQLAPRYP